MRALRAIAILGLCLAATNVLGAIPSLASDTLPLAPKDVGRCVDTTITHIGERLRGCAPIGDKPGECGLTVSYANGGYQVSYQTDKTVKSTWRINDPVRFCLESITSTCLAIDEPSDGRIFVVTNLRNGHAWRAASSQQDCFPPRPRQSK